VRSYAFSESDTYTYIDANSDTNTDANVGHGIAK
jgi:hypothetical protein